MARQPITRANPYTPKRGAFAGRTFYSERQYRNALAQRKGFASLSAQQRAPRPIRSRQAYERLSRRERKTQQRAAAAVATMKREGISLSEAARQEKTTPNTVRKYAGHALERRGSRVVVKERHHLYRRMEFLTPDGKIEIDVTNSKTASDIGRYFNVVKRYIYMGEEHGLREFHGKFVQAGKVKHPYITDTAILDELAERGELSYEDIYEEIDV